MSSQSESRLPGRGRPPASFGRTDQPEEDFTVQGGNSIHVVVHADVIPNAESLEVLRAAVRETTRLGVLEGYAQAFAEMDATDEADGADGGALHRPPDSGG